jgi:hypothetical protein
MTKHILLVESNAVEGREDEYNSWYSDQHLGDIIGVKGFVSARRFEAQPSVQGLMPPYKYLAIHEIENDDLPSVIDALVHDAATMYISPAFDITSAKTYAFTQIKDTTDS